jgi:hypothetical protein
MNAEAFNQSAAVFWFLYGILGIRPIADPCNALACARARCYAPRDRCAIEFGKQRFVAPKRISLLRISLRTKAPLLHETQDTLMDAFRNTGNFGIRRRPNSLEYRIALTVVDIEAIQGHQMCVRVEI